MTKSTYIIGIIAVILIGGALYTYMARPATDPGSVNTNGADQPANGQPANNSQMSFFVTSKNPGKGGDLGGLAGADDYCQALADDAGAGDQTWRAYLSATATDNSAAVNARDRIGNGPWQNFNGVLIAANPDNLHDNNNLNKETALTEKGEAVNGRGDTPNLHDILTGSGMDGLAIATSTDTTCGNWTSSDAGSAMVGHHDRVGLREDEPSRSWNSSHLSRGCSLEALASSGGGGLFYCFAVKE